MLNLKTANQSCWMTLWPMMMHQHHLPSWEVSSPLTFTGILNFFCDLDIDQNRAIQSFHKTIKLVMMCHQTKFTCKKISSFEDILESYILIIWFFTVSLTTTTKSFWKTTWFMMMYHHTKFGSKRFSGSEDTAWTFIHWHFDILLRPWPWTEQSNFFIRDSGLWKSTTKPSLEANETVVQRI